MKTDKNHILLELDAWDAAESGARRAVALAVAYTIRGFEFVRLASHSAGGQTHEIAFFRHEDAEFALLPGCSRATLGYDRSRPWELTAEQTADWELTAREYGISLSEYLDQYLSPLRHVRIDPLLVEVSAQAHEYHQDGHDQTEGYLGIVAACGSEFRLPTVDEWEYACCGGGRSLFRCGDVCPVSNSNDEKKSGLHRQPNAFGLMMNSSTYGSEVCQGPKLRGGDGGCSVCGGMGNVATWLPFATSFQVPDEEVDAWWIDDVFVRRVCPVPVVNSLRDADVH